MNAHRMTPKQWGRAYFALGGDPAHLDREDLREAAGKPLGTQNELLVVEALRTVEPRPWWLFGARKALPEEDRAGINVVVLSRDAGAFGLQVKSSQHNVQRWIDEHPELVGKVGLVVVAREDDLTTIWARAMGALILLREGRQV